MCHNGLELVQNGPDAASMGLIPAQLWLGYFTALENSSDL